MADLLVREFMSIDINNNYKIMQQIEIINYVTQHYNNFKNIIDHEEKVLYDIFIVDGKDELKKIIEYHQQKRMLMLQNFSMYLLLPSKTFLEMEEDMEKDVLFELT